MAGWVSVPFSRCINAFRVPVDERPFLWQSSRRSLADKEFKPSANVEGCDRRGGCDRRLRVAGIVESVEYNLKEHPLQRWDSKLYVEL